MPRARFHVPLLVAVFAAACLPSIAAEGRIPVYMSPTVIAAPGHYILTRDLPPSPLGGPVIDITSPFVDLDLNGFTVDNTGVSAPVIKAQGQDVRIHNGKILGGNRSIDVAPGLKITIEDIRAEAAQGESFYLLDVENVTIRRNVILDAAREGILLDGGIQRNGTIEENIIRRSRGGLRVRAGTSMTIRLNRIEEQLVGPQGAGITLEDGRGLLVERNTIETVEDDGIHCVDTAGSKFHNNVITEVSDSGIFLDATSHDNLLLTNVVSAANGNGILVLSDRNHIEDNLSNSNQICGLFLSTGSSSNVYRRNVARGNNAPQCLGGCPATSVISTSDFCDDGAGNHSAFDNFLPAPGM